MTLPATPFGVPPKLPELTAAAPVRSLQVKNVDRELVAEETGDVIDVLGSETLPRRHGDTQACARVT